MTETTQRSPTHLVNSRRAFALILLLASCRLFEETCTTYTNPAVQVVVSEEGTSLRPSTEVILAITDGVTPDTARYPAGSGAPITMAAGYNMSGALDMSVSAQGYAAWVRTGVIVGLDRCGRSDTRTFAAELARE
jgi:hypothetical protein